MFSLLIHPLVRELELDERHDHNEYCQKNGRRRCKPLIVVALDPLLPDEIDDGRRTRIPRRKHLGIGIRLQSADHARDKQVECHGRDERKRNGKELPYLSRAVKRGRLIQVSGNIEHAGKVQDHRAAHRIERILEDDRNLDGHIAIQPDDIQSQKRIEHTVAAENIVPDDVESNRTRDSGNIIEHLEKFGTLDLAKAEQPCQDEPQDHAERHAQKKNDGIHDCLAKERRTGNMREQIDVVCKSDVFRDAGKRIVVLETIDECKDDGERSKNEKSDDRGENEQKGDEMLFSFLYAHLFFLRNTG